RHPIAHDGHGVPREIDRQRDEEQTDDDAAERETEYQFESGEREDVVADIASEDWISDSKRSAINELECRAPLRCHAQREQRRDEQCAEERGDPHTAVDHRARRRWNLDRAHPSCALWLASG